MNVDQLSKVLKANGYLQRARVSDIALSPIKTNGIGSSFFRAEIKYSNSDHALPARLLIKRPLVSDRGQGEADVYQRILIPARCPAVVQCYGIVDEGPNEPLALLFEDLSSSHHQTDWPIIPRFDDCRQAVSTLAQVHALWWGKTTGFDADAAPVLPHQNPKKLAGVLPSFIEALGDYLSPRKIQLIEGALASAERLMQQRASAEHATLLHNDAHFWNFLYPNGRAGRCVVFDWPLWRAGFAGIDLAYMIALHLYPEHRRRFETQLLQEYTRSLNEHGVSISQEHMLEDYRAGLVFSLMTPILEFSWRNPPISWLPKLEKAFAAIADLECEELM